MDISKKLYQELTPSQRAIACYSALNRNDQTEADRIIGHAPRDGKHGQAILALGQALDAYNCLTARATTNYLVISGRLHAALSYCSAWLDADGAIDNQEYMEKFAMVQNLTPLNEQLAGEVESIRQAALEWCSKNQIPKDFFSGPLCYLPMPKEVAEQSESETLNAVRSLFEKITLVW
jgi:hypothetical protein